jgi:molybdopterin-guanine dinucleotide biosynthesis protein A
MGGGDKPMRAIDGRTLLDCVISRLRPQCDDLLLNANGDPGRFETFRLPVVADSFSDYPGPLAGVLSALDWAASQRPSTRWVASVPGDCPFLPRDLTDRLHSARRVAHAHLAVAESGGQRHPVIGLWRVDLREDLRGALRSGIRKIEAWTEGYSVALASWSIEPVDPFFNVNTAEDLAEAERLMGLLEGSASFGRNS